MNRFDAALTLLIAVIFLLLMTFAGQPVTPEAARVQQWYDALCDPTLDQSPLWDWTWRGSWTISQLQDAFARYRVRTGLPEPCTPRVNHNVIYFNWLPPTLSAAVERIKFVAVNVYGTGRPTEPNLIGSVQTGVHVLYDHEGQSRIFPRFFALSPLGVHPTHQPVPLHNNDGLLMGQVEVTGFPFPYERAGEIRLAVPLRLTAHRPWGRYEIQAFINGIEVIPEYYSDVLPLEEQARFLPPAADSIAAAQVVEGLFYVMVLEPVTDFHLAITTYQTPWDMRPLPVLIDVI